MLTICLYATCTKKIHLWGLQWRWRINFLIHLLGMNLVEVWNCHFCSTFSLYNLFVIIMYLYQFQRSSGHKILPTWIFVSDFLFSIAHWNSCIVWFIFFYVSHVKYVLGNTQIAVGWEKIYTCFTHKRVNIFWKLRLGCKMPHVLLV
jgi:hypothetical protein